VSLRLTERRAKVREEHYGGNQVGIPCRRQVHGASKREQKFGPPGLSVLKGGGGNVGIGVRRGNSPPNKNPTGTKGKCHRKEQESAGQKGGKKPAYPQNTLPGQPGRGRQDTPTLTSTDAPLKASRMKVIGTPR